MGTSEVGISDAEGLLVEENCMVLEFTGGDNKQVTLGKLELQQKELTLDSRIPHFRGVRHWHFHANPWKISGGPPQIFPLVARKIHRSLA
jgi:hypothetical protein